MTVQSVCNPDSPPGRAANRAEIADPGGAFAATARAVNTQVRQSVEQWRDHVRRGERFLREVQQTDIIEDLKRLADEGFLRVGPDGDLATAEVNLESVNLRNLGIYMTVYKNKQLALGGGLTMQSDALIRKFRNGENITADALAYAQQMRAIAKTYDWIIQNDLFMGRNMLLQRFDEFFEGTWLEGKFGKDVARKAQELTDQHVDVLTKAIKKLNDGNVKGGVEDILKHAEFVKLHRGDPRHAIRATSKLHVLGEMIWTVAVNGLLSSPRTWVVNAASATNAISRPIFQLAGGALWQQAAQAMGWDNTARGARRATAMAAAEIQGQWTAFQDALRLGWNTVKTDGSLYGGNMDINQVMESVNGGWNGANLRALMPDQVSRNIEPGNWAYDSFDVLGKFITRPGQMLQGGDDFAKHLVIRGQVQANAVGRAIDKEGFDILGDKKALEAFIQQEKEMAFNMAAPDLTDKFQFRKTYEHYARVMGEAKYSTFQEDTQFVLTANKIRNAPVIGPVIRTFVPFLKTPVNIVKQGFIDSTGLGLAIKAGRYEGSDEVLGLLQFVDKVRLASTDDPEGWARMLGQTAFFGVVAGTVYSLAASGNMTGGGPKRWSNESQKWEMDQTWVQMRRGQGFTGNPYEVKIGSVVMSLDRFGEPFAMPMKMIADIHEMSGWMSQSDQDETMGLATQIMLTGAFQGSFLEGVQRLVDLVLDEDPGGRKWAMAAQGAASVYMPMSGMLSYLQQQEDPYRSLPNYRDPDLWWANLGSFWNGLSERIRMRLPGQGANPHLIDPIFGEKVPVYPGIGDQNMSWLQLTVPFMPTGFKPRDTLYTEIFQLVGAYVPPTTTRVPLTNGELSRLNEIQGKEVYLNGMTKAQAFRKFMDRPDVAAYRKTPYGRNPDIKLRVEAEFRRLDRRYYEAALAKLMKETPSVAQRQALNDLKKEAERRNDGETAMAAKRQLDAAYLLAREAGTYMTANETDRPGYAQGFVTPEMMGQDGVPLIPGN